jgi:hypothetical protein
MILDTLIDAWSGLLVMIGLVAWIAFSKPQDPLRTKVALVAPIVAAVLELVTIVALVQLGELTNLLLRDAIALIVISALIPCCVLISLRALPAAGASRSVALVFGAVCGLALALMSSFLVLVVHCTSGDCL